jgi:WD40 repeat protein
MKDDFVYMPGGDSGEVGVYSLYGASGDPASTLRGHLKMVYAIAQRRSTQDLITASKDGLILMWQSRGGNNTSMEAEDALEDEDAWSDDEDDADNDALNGKCIPWQNINMI